MMPGMDGFDLAKRLRLLPSCAKAPIVFLRRVTQQLVTKSRDQAGARNYITKPFSN